MNYIADAKTKYFRNRAHYMLFKAAWAEAVNNKDIHLKAEHFMFYNAIRGVEITRGFTERKSLKKIYHQGWVNLAQDEAQFRLNQAARYSAPSFVEIFDGTVDVDTFRQVVSDMPRIPQKIEFHRNLSFDDWADEYVSKQLANLRTTIERNSTPIEPEFREALWKASQRATLISEGELHE